MARRTVRTITLIVETPDEMSDAEHDKRVFWAENNVMNANNRRGGDGYFVATVIPDGSGGTRFSGSGEPTPETEHLIEDLKKGA